MSASACGRLPTAALSVSSNTSACGLMPLLRISPATYSVNFSSRSDWPEQLIVNTTDASASSAACGCSISIVCAITQRSISGIIW